MSKVSQESKMNWVGDVNVGKCGNGWFVRIDGTDVFDDINQHGCKTRRTLSISERLESCDEAKQVAINWLKHQIKLVSK